MTDKIVECPQCQSRKARIKAYREASKSYLCKDCGTYYSRPNDHYRECDGVETHSKIVSWDMETANKGSVEGDAPSLDEAIKKYKIDTSEWFITKYKTEEREATLPVAQGGGKHSLYKLTLDVERKNPRPNLPVVQPVYLKDKLPSFVSASKKKKEKLKTALILSDAHIGYRRDIKSGKLHPYHDRSVWGLIFEVVQEMQPDDIIINGDLLDCAELTDKFAREPNVFFTLQPSLMEAKFILRQLQMLAPEAKLVYIEGNHEQRLPNFMVKHFNSAFDLTAIGEEYPALSIPQLLKLDEMNVEWVGEYPDGAYWLNENLAVKHGNKSKTRAGATAESYLEAARCSLITGHIHRAERASRRLHHYDGPREYFAECFGMVGSPERTPGHTKYTNWQQGFGVAYYEEGDGGFTTTPISVFDSKVCIFMGRTFEGQDYVNLLRNTTGWSAF